MTAERFPRVDLSAVDDEPLQLDLDGLAYRGLAMAIVAPTGSGKTLFAEWLLIGARRSGRTVAHLDMEIGKRGTARNYRAHGVTPKELRGIHYVEMPEPRMEEAAEFTRAVLDNGEDVALFDKLPDFLRSARLAENSNDDVNEWAGAFLDPLRERCTVVLVHATGWEGNRSRGASELMFKLDVVWELKVAQEFDRHRVGRIRLKCTKDRWGDIGLGRVVEYAIGGDGKGRLVVRRVSDAYEAAVDDGMTDKERRLRQRDDALRRAAVATARQHAPDELHAITKSDLEALIGGYGRNARDGIALAIADGDPSHARLGSKPNPRGRGVVVWYVPARIGEEAGDAAE
jgi:hypothetical protein